MPSCTIVVSQSSANGCAASGTTMYAQYTFISAGRSIRTARLASADCQLANARLVTPGSPSEPRPTSSSSRSTPRRRSNGCPVGGRPDGSEAAPGAQGGRPLPSRHYGYRPNKSALQAVGTCRSRCWRTPSAITCSTKWISREDPGCPFRFMSVGLCGHCEAGEANTLLSLLRGRLSRLLACGQHRGVRHLRWAPDHPRTGNLHPREVFSIEHFRTYIAPVAYCRALAVACRWSL